MCPATGRPSQFDADHLIAEPPGASIQLRVCIVIKVGVDGLITRIDEHFDPADMAPLLTS